MTLLFGDDPLFEKTVRNLFPFSAERFEGLYSCKDGFRWIFRWSGGDLKLGALWSFEEVAFADEFSYKNLRHFLSENYPEMLL